MPAVTKNGYTCNFNTNSSGTGTAYASGGTYTPSTTTSSATLYVRCIQNPATPTITGGDTKIFNYEPTTLTCATSTTYATGVTKYYSFGYATSDGGTPSNWTTASTTATYSATATYTTRYYSCRVYATDGTQTSGTVTSATNADAQVTFVNARIDFDATTNGGTISGTTPLYVPYNATNIYTGRTNTTAGTIPTASKTGYTFQGWYTAQTGGTKVIAADRTVQASVSGWTDANKKWLKQVHQIQLILIDYMLSLLLMKFH